MDAPIEFQQAKSPWPWRLRLAMGVGLLAVVAWRVDLSALSVRWDGALLLGVLGAASALLATRWVSAVRWGVIAELPASRWSYLFHLYMVTGFFSLFLPTSVGGDVVRAVAVRRVVPASGEAVAGVVLDRLSGVVAMVFYLGLGALIAPATFGVIAGHLGLSIPAWVVYAAACVGLAGLALVVALPGRFGVLRRLGADGLALVSRLVRTPRALLATLGLSLAIQALHIASWMALASGMRFGLGLPVFLVTVPLVSLAAMLPITISGLGVREGLWVVFLTPFGLVPANVVTYSLLYFLVTTAIGALGGILFATRGLHASETDPMTAPAPSTRE